MKVIAKQPYTQTTPSYPPLARIARWAALPLLALALVAGILALSGGRPSGTLEAAQTLYNLGDVPIDGGLVTVQFPLTVQGETLVTEIETSCMCTQARLVQGDRVSDWFGMTHDASAPLVRVDLEPGEPAFLEVQMDPAAHGPEGVGPVERGIIVRTASGQALQFVVAATITR